MSYHRLRFSTEAEARSFLVSAGIENSDGQVHMPGVSVVHLGPLHPDGCPGCLNAPTAEAPDSCAVAAGTGPCPAACWHVDVITPGDEPLPGEIVVNSPKHTFL